MKNLHSLSISLINLEDVLLLDWPGKKFVHKYLELQHISRFQSQISSYCKSIPIWFSKYHGWWCGRTESLIFNHSFIGQHQPHTHLIHRVIKSWLLIKVLIETIQTTQRGNLIALKTRKNFLVHDMQNHVPLVFLGKYGRISKLTNFFFSWWFNKQKCSATVYLIL